MFNRFQISSVGTVAVLNANNEVSERMVWDEVLVFSVVVHSSEVCVVEHTPHLVLP